MSVGAVNQDKIYFILTQICIVVPEKAGFISNSYNLKCPVSQYEELVPSELCKTYEEARKVFKAGSKFVENAVKYYTFDEYVTDFVEIKQVRFLIH